MAELIEWAFAIAILPLIGGVLFAVARTLLSRRRGRSASEAAGSPADSFVLATRFDAMEQRPPAFGDESTGPPSDGRHEGNGTIESVEGREGRWRP